MPRNTKTSPAKSPATPITAAPVETARDFYHHCPELVVSMSPDLIRCIAESAA